MTIGGEVKNSVISQKGEHLVAGRVDAFAEIEGVFERLSSVFAHGHPDVVASETTFAFGSEVEDQLVARKGRMSYNIQGVDTSNFHGTGLREGTAALARDHDLAAVLAVGAVLATGEVELGVFRVHEGCAFAGFGVDVLTFIGKRGRAPVALAVLFGDEEVGEFLTGDAVFLLASSRIACGGEDDFVVVVAEPAGAVVGVPRRVHLFQFSELVFGGIVLPFLNLLCGFHTELSTRVFGHFLRVEIVHLDGILEFLVHLVGLSQIEIELRMGVGIFCLQQALVVRLGTLGETDEAVAFPHLEIDAVALVFVAAHLTIGLLVAVGSLGVLLAAKGQIGVFGWVSSLRIDVGAHEDEQGRHDDQDVSFHRRDFSYSQTRKGRF